MTTEELIARLRDDSGNWLTDAAADRIEELTAEVAQAKAQRDRWSVAYTEMLLERDDEEAARQKAEAERDAAMEALEQVAAERRFWLGGDIAAATLARIKEKRT